jgi:hypothetical protein
MRYARESSSRSISFWLGSNSQSLIASMLRLQWE